MLCKHTTNLVINNLIIDNICMGNTKAHGLSKDEKIFLKGVSQLGTLSLEIAESGKSYEGDMVHKAA